MFIFTLSINQSIQQKIYMLLPYLPILNKKHIILGSQSQSRRQLIDAQKIQYEAIPSTFEENLDKSSFHSPAQYNLATCKGKVDELLKRFQTQNKEWDLLICGDTIVEHQDKIIQKPNEQHCIEMVQELSNNTHRIFTAHVIVFNTHPIIQYQWVSSAEVTFGNIPLEVIQIFAKQPEPYKHSGAYELSAMSGSFLKEIKGSHSAVQGLDMYQLCSRITEGARKAGWIQ